MAIGVTDDKHYKAIADVLRSYTNPDNTFTPSEMPDGIVNAVNAGTNTARQEGYDSGYEAGKKSEYDRFWDAYQDYGKRVNYAQIFYNNGWNKDTFNPKYDIICEGNCYGIFTYSAIVDTIKNIDVTKATDVGSLFNACTQLEIVRNLIVSENVPITAWFNNCSKLKNLTITGAIGKNGLNLKWSTLLTKESIISVINALSSTTSGLSCTLSQVAVNNAFTDAEWSALIATKTNWTISLV